MNRKPIIITGIPIPRIRSGGRPKGSGRNVKLLNKLTPDSAQSCIWGVDKKTANSLRTSAHQQGMPCVIRKLDDGTYGVWRVSSKPKRKGK